MKKSHIFISAAILIILMSIFALTNGDRIKNRIFIAIDNRLDYERSIEQGDEFNKIVWGDTCYFQINHHKWGNDLEYVIKGEKTTILSCIKNYKIYRDKLYVISSNGYAVINRDNIARVYVDTENLFNIEDVKRLSSFDQFTEEERKVFDKLIKY